MAAASAFQLQQHWLLHSSISGTLLAALWDPEFWTPPTRWCWVPRSGGSVIASYTPAAKLPPALKRIQCSSGGGNRVAAAPALQACFGGSHCLAAVALAPAPHRYLRSSAARAPAATLSYMLWPLFLGCSSSYSGSSGYSGSILPASSGRQP